MKRLIIATLFLYQVLGEPIVGGHICDIKIHPWLVSIHRGGNYVCVGSIISESVILTAAHCVKESISSYNVRVGSSRTDSGGTWHGVVRKQQHQYYSKVRGITVNDTALLKVWPAIKFGDNVTAIQLAGPGHDMSAGTSAIVAGWGVEAYRSSPSRDLKSTSVYIVDSRECSQAYGDKTGTFFSDNSQICAARRGTDACTGDSGAPLIEGHFQIGIVSSGKGCANPKFPGIYTDVTRYRDWIDTTSRELQASRND